VHDVFFQLHSGLAREAPGSDATTRQAFALLPPLPPRPRVLDVGCGPGAQTVLLAQLTGGHVTAVDLHAPYLEVLRERAAQAGVADRVTVVQADMGALPFAPGSFDLVWAEGSAYVLGFERALHTWRPLLAAGAHLVLTEAVWLRPDPPDEVRAFWQ
jgi:ubiquinone/menaquinone biosynthesis C-methylase UbiE